MSSASHSRLSPTFWCFHTLILIAMSSLPWVRAIRLYTPPPLPAPVLNEPVEVSLRYDEPKVVTDKQLAAVLAKARPRLRKPRPKISVLDHALRCWGTTAEFADPQCLSGLEMQQVLLDHQAYVELWGTEVPPLLNRESDGVAVRTLEGASTSNHVDHTLATLAEVGTPLDQPIHAPGGPASMRDVFTHAVRNFSLNQKEYEWTALALALYAPTPQPWISKEGQWITFDILAKRIMRQELGTGVCCGQHRLYTLAVLLQVNESHEIMQPATAQAVEDHLLAATVRLTRTQHAEGWWDANWSHGQPLAGEQKLGDRSRRLLATGHVMEWWAIAPRNVLPPREVYIRAGQWLVREIEQLDAPSVEKNYTFLSHAARALALWRGGLPATSCLPTTCLNVSAPNELADGER